jgi:hypothetical protein
MIGYRTACSFYTFAMCLLPIALFPPFGLVVSIPMFFFLRRRCARNQARRGYTGCQARIAPQARQAPWGAAPETTWVRANPGPPFWTQGR